MTAHSDFKTLVRARMAEKEESYATARAALLALRSSPKVRFRDLPSTRARERAYHALMELRAPIRMREDEMLARWRADPAWQREVSASDGPTSFEDLYFSQSAWPRRQSILVRERDPEFGPYVPVFVPFMESETPMPAGYRDFTEAEANELFGDSDDVEEFG